jgi:glycine/D-amino acid oxidase-like deaminating enzyme
VPDVVVVGGGIIGAACALELAARGASVTLIEREHLAAGASGRNLGLLMMPDDGALVPMYRAGVDAYREVVDEAPFDVFMDRESTGVVQVALDETDLPEAEAHAAFLSGQGVVVERLTTASRARELEPALADGLAGVWFVDHGRRVDPGALTVALATLATARGAAVRHHLQVRTLHAPSGRVRGVVTDEGVLPADAVVVAAGPWSPALLEPAGVRLPVWPVRGWLVRVAPPRPGLVRHIVERVGWTGVGRLNERPDAGGLGASPGANVGAALHPGDDGTITCGSSWEHATAPEPEDPTMPARITAMNVRVVPELAKAEVLGSWWGLRPVTPDDRPVVDRVAEGLFVATGHGALGVILGAGTAQLVASQVLGSEPPFDAAPFRAGRFAAGAPGG